MKMGCGGGGFLKSIIEYDRFIWKGIDSFSRVGRGEVGFGDDDTLLGFTYGGRKMYQHRSSFHPASPKALDPNVS